MTFPSPGGHRVLSPDIMKPSSLNRKNIIYSIFTVCARSLDQNIELLYTVSAELLYESFCLQLSNEMMIKVTNFDV